MLNRNLLNTVKNITVLVSVWCVIITFGYLFFGYIKAIKIVNADRDNKFAEACESKNGIVVTETDGKVACVDQNCIIMHKVVLHEH